MCEGRLEAVFAISPSVATLRPVVSRKFGKTVSFINAHLQQRDQVASELRTVDSWLIVCGDSRVLTVATK